MTPTTIIAIVIAFTGWKIVRLPVAGKEQQRRENAK